MKMICRTCQSEAYHINTCLDDNGDFIDTCDRCGASNADTDIPDVYWPGHEYESPNLCDKMGKPYKLTSKREKARVMKEIGVRELGDKHHGAPIMPTTTWTEGTRDYRKRQYNNGDRQRVAQVYKEWLSRRG